jgi:hypothetical protein
MSIYYFALVIILHLSLIFLISIYYILLNFSISACSFIFADLLELFFSYHFRSSILFYSPSSFLNLLLTLIHEFDWHFTFIRTTSRCKLLIIKGIHFLSMTFEGYLTRCDGYRNRLLWWIKFILCTILRLHYVALWYILLIKTFISLSLKIISVTWFFWHYFLSIIWRNVKFIAMSSRRIHY